MIRTVIALSLLTACQDTEKENQQDQPEPLTNQLDPVAVPTQIFPEDSQSEAMETPITLPDLLECASESTGHLDFFGMPYVVIMDLQNIYSQANTAFFIDHVHEPTQEGFQGGMVGGEAVYQSEPLLTEDSIHIVLNDAHMETSNLTWLNMFRGDGSLSLTQNGADRFSGTLSFPEAQNMRPALEMHCWSPTIQPEYTYNTESGLCLNEAGQVGFNPASQAEVRETGNGQCVNMNGWIIDEGNYSYPNFDWDLRGADLTGASISFAHMKQADFRGAKMAGFSYGYSQLVGEVDGFTTLPVGCEAENNWIDCTQ